ncbi:hypothetical protein GCM10027294_43720 [Marinactinospora endophytica]
MEYTVQAPTEGFSGDVAGTQFREGTAVVDSVKDASVLAYFRRRGYRVTRGTAGQETNHDGTGSPVQTGSDPDPGSPEVPNTAVDAAVADRPSKNASKDVWAAYVAATTDLSDAETAEMTKAELIARADADRGDGDA